MAASANLSTTAGRGRPRRSWRHVWTVFIAAFWIAILFGVIGGFFFHWRWTGFQQNGTLWDWIQLLSAPVFVSTLPFIFGRSASAGVAGGAATAPASPGDGVPQHALDAYREHILDLLLNRGLSGSEPGSAVREVARARTLTALRQVGPARKREVLELLQETGLMHRDRPIVELHEADLRAADLHGLNLSAADLRDADLGGADLRGADLRDADLRGAELHGADLQGAVLTGAELPRTGEPTVR